MIITRIERVIAHEVIRTSELSIKNPTYSNVLVNLNEQIKNLLINRIITVVAPGIDCVDLTVDDVSQGRPFKPSLGETIKNKRKESVFYKDSVIILLSWLASNNAIDIHKLWPEDLNYLEDFYITIGISLNGLF